MSTNAPVRTVAIAGPPGAGKSTLVRAVARAIKAAGVFHYDDYQTITAWPREKLDSWIARGSDPNEIPLDRLVNDLERARAGATAGGVILLETPLGRAHRDTGRLIDLLIWIALPLDIALARHVASQIALARDAIQPAASVRFLQWLAGHLHGYELFMRDLYQRQAELVGANADLTVDGRRPVDQLVETVRVELAARGFK